MPHPNLGQFRQRPERTGFQCVNVLDDDQRRFVRCGLLQGKDAEHPEQLVGRVVIELVAELVQDALEELGGVHAVAVDDGHGAAGVEGMDEPADERRLAGERGRLHDRETVRCRANGIQRLQRVAVRGVGHGQDRVAVRAERLLSQPGRGEIHFV